jgi:uncharacterized paraquat-inducible protein A
MNKLLVAALGAVLFVAVGCQNDGGSSSGSARSDRDTMTVRTERSETMRGEDDCTHCSGSQTARADGTCPQCGMKVRSASR